MGELEMGARSFRVVLERAEKGGYVVKCLDVPGAVSQGETEEEALENIKDAVRGILEARKKLLYRKRVRIVKVVL